MFLFRLEDLIATIVTCRQWESSCAAEFDTQEWHRQLFDFGGSGGDEEADVVPNLVRSLAVPLVKHAALKVPPLSTSGTRGYYSSATLSLSVAVLMCCLASFSYSDQCWYLRVSGSDDDGV